MRTFPSKHWSSLEIITCNIMWKWAGRQSELPSGREKIAELTESCHFEARMWCEHYTILGIYTSLGTQTVSRGSKSLLYWNVNPFYFYHTWCVSDLISCTKCRAVMIYVASGLPIVGLQHPHHWPGSCLAPRAERVRSGIQAANVRMTWKANVFALSEEV